jgi:glycosyltransferase involved in cell wall biosynthesis
VGNIIRIKEVFQLWKIVCDFKNKIDVIHSFGRLAGLLPVLSLKIPKIQSYQRAVTRKNIQIASILGKHSIYFTACSDNCRQYGHLPGNWETIYNAVPIEKYIFVEKVPDDAPLVFLGRIEKIKGCHNAIKAARMAGRRLIIAGNIVRHDESYNYFTEEIEPHIDGKMVKYIGEVDDSQKNNLLGNAAALLMPIEWDEPFGIVMAEALACGTPIIGFKRGAIPEVVVHGSNGFLCYSITEMVQAIYSIKKIERSSCRTVAQEKFSGTVVGEKYLRLYRTIINKSSTEKRA